MKKGLKNKNIKLKTEVSQLKINYIDLKKNYDELKIDYDELKNKKSVKSFMDYSIIQVFPI
jgi:hypothetical protein